MHSYICGIRIQNDEYVVSRQTKKAGEANTLHYVYIDRDISAVVTVAVDDDAVAEPSATSTTKKNNLGK